MSSDNLIMLRRRRHRSDPPTVDVSSPLQSSQISLSVGVSPTSATTAAPVSVREYSALEEELQTKLEMSLKKEKALSQRYDRKPINLLSTFLSLMSDKFDRNCYLSL